MNIPSAEECVKAFLSYLEYERNASPHTVKAYHRDIQDFLDYLQELAPRDVTYSMVGTKELRRWMLYLTETKGLKASAAKRKLSALRTWYSYLRRKGVVEQNPTRGLHSPKVPKPLPTYVEAKQLMQLIQELYRDYEESKRFRDLNKALVVDLLFQTGLRRAELCSLKLEDIDFGRMQFKVMGKRSKERILPFGTCLEEKLKLYLSKRAELEPVHSFLICTEEGRAAGVAEVYMLVREALSAFPALSKRSPHVLRHSFATAMLNSGAQLLSIKELLGHSDLSATTIYTHTSFKELQKMYNAHPRAQKRTTMDIKMNANHFEPSDQLKEYVQKKVGKLERFYRDIISSEVVLSLIKPETKENKEAKLIVNVKNDELFAEKRADSFEEAVSLACEAVEKQIAKYKEKYTKK